MVTFKIRARILIGLLLFLSIWLTYQYMESLFGQPYLQNNEILRTEDKQKVTVTVYYECLCPDSKSFILNHLLPSYGKAPDLIELELIPYGKAETKMTADGYEFQCQHGPVECLGNKVHACVLSKVKNKMQRLQTVACLLDDISVNFNSVGLQCSKKLGIEWGPIMACASGTEGSSLLKAHGDSTDLLSPKISFVPTVLLNHQRNGQPAILKNLWKEICKLLPEMPAACL